MAYNLQSLITILEQILNPQQTRWILDDDKPQLESLLKTAASLQKFVGNSSVPRVESVESQIRDASHEAEDIIERQLVYQMLFSPEGESFTFSTPDLQEVTQQLDSATEHVAELMKGKNVSTGSGCSSSSGASFSSLEKSIVVGVDADLRQLKDRLTGTKSKLEIIPIVGMGGVGKTTLARKLYEDPLILSHFKCLAWTTISQDFNMKAILLGLLRCIIGKELDQHIEKESDELRDVLYQNLYGRKYMIVLDDVWSTGFWDVIRMYFPDNSNGSRIVITTRELNVARYADSQSLHHEVQLLSESQSWDLLRQIVFGEDDCPRVLQEIGTMVARDCGGLPLAINVIGGLLSKIERSEDAWENIGKDVRAAIAESDKQFSQILYLSYNHLPNHLKPCFLYMGAFPEDHEIKTSKLVQMWVAEGFAKSNSNGDESLEDEAEDYLKSLVERNLVLVTDYEYNGKPKRCSMHDLLRDVCMRKANEEKFLHIRNEPEAEITCSLLRRVSVPTSHGLGAASASSGLIPRSRSFLYTGPPSYAIQFESLAFFALLLLRVLDVFRIPFENFPEEILLLVNLRYLALECDKIPTGISKLCNLQTLIADVGYGLVPTELLEMSELRHIMINKAIWMTDDYMKTFALNKLETMNCVVLDLLVIGSRGLFKKFPNIKSLGICFSDDFRSDIAVDLTRFHRLETLRCQSRFCRRGRCYLTAVTYPRSLTKLTLQNCVISPTALKTVCALSKLEALKIRRCVFESKGGREWEAAEGDVFLSLQYLKLDDSDMVRWRADETNFPRLRHLFIRGCSSLEGIPDTFGEISALQLIELRGCNDSVVASAKQIQEVQQCEFDNDQLQLRVYDTRLP